MDFYVAAYYLIQGTKKQKGMDKDGLLPEKIWSGSRHICPKIPDAWIFNWVTDKGSIADLKYARTQLSLSDDDFFNAQKEFDELLLSHQYEFPNVFMNREIAADKFNKHFYSVPDLKLLGLAMSSTYYEIFVESYSGDGKRACRENGVYKKIIQKEICDYPAIGFDLLGWDGADFCSFLCGSMESEIHEKYGVQYNQLGLIMEFEQAEKVSNAIKNGIEIVEDGFWCPWLVFEIQTQ